MDRFGHLAPSLDELKQIQSEVRGTSSMAQLRNYFERVQELRRIHSGNFDVQILVAEAQEGIIERARDLRSRSESEEDAGDLFGPSSLPLTTPRPAAPVPVDRAETLRERSVHSGDRPDVPPAPVDEEADAASKNWRRATLLALVFTAGICIVFFYLIQTARRINLPQSVQTPPKSAASAPKTQQPVVKPATPTDSAALTSPAVRLYTDLIPGTVSVDDGDPQDLKDGELILDHLQPGRHSIKVAGRNGNAAFSFNVGSNGAPQAIAPLTASGALAVAVSAQDGKGHLLTSAEQPQVSLDGKSLGNAGADGLELTDLGTSDHDLNVDQTDDHQHFVLTYASAPVLTFYVKSVFNGGVVTLKTNEDGAVIFINDKPLRRKTERGEMRLPLKAGTYTIRLHKDGFTDPAPQTLQIKKGDEPALTFDLAAPPSMAYLDVRGAAAKTAVLVDGRQVATVGNDGHATAAGISPGQHGIELRLDGSQPKEFTRVFEAGKAVSLSGSETVLQSAAPKPNETAATTAAPPPQVTQQPPAEKPASSAESSAEQTRRGGGFVSYNDPRAPGRYSFQARAKVGGMFRHDKLQWYAAYENSENYVMFTVDGKRASIRMVSSGRSRDINRIPFNADSDQWVQVQMSVSATQIQTQIKTASSGWTDLGTVKSDGRDLTQGQVGFYLPGNDEVVVSNFHFSPQR